MLQWTEHLAPYVFNGDDNTLGTTTLANGSHILAVVATATDGTTSSIQSADVASNSGLVPGNLVLPSMAGTAQQAQTVTATTGTWAGSPVSYTYRWRSCDASGNGCADIPGATSAGYVPQATDVGHTLRVVVTATNAGGSTSATSAADRGRAPLAAGEHRAACDLGDGAAGSDARCVDRDVERQPDLVCIPVARLRYDGANCADIAGATSSTYVLQAADVGHTLRVVVTATNGGGSTPATSAQTTAVVGRRRRTRCCLSVSGPAQLGQTLRASSGNWTGSPTVVCVPLA